MSKLLAYLDITWWGVSLGGEHFSARLVGTNADDSRYSEELTHPLSNKETLYLNKKSGARGYSLYSPGEESPKFWTEGELIRCAIKKYKALIPRALALVKGNSAVGDPQQVLDGPEPYKSATNELWLEFQRIGYYEGDEKRSHELFLEYQKLEKTLDDYKKPDKVVVNEARPIDPEIPFRLSN